MSTRSATARRRVAAVAAAVLVATVVPTGAAQAGGQHRSIASRIGYLSGLENEKSELGTPGSLALGIIGYVPSGRGHRFVTVHVGRGEDVGAIRRLVLKGLPASAGDLLTIVERDVATRELTRIWNEISRARWNPDGLGYGMGIDTRRAAVDISVGGLTPTIYRRLKAIGGEHVVVEEGGVIRLAARGADGDVVRGRADVESAYGRLDDGLGR